MADLLFVRLSGDFSILQWTEFLIRLIVACLCGACVGMERSRRFKDAGVRTHILVCCASALIMIISKYGFGDVNVGDPARLAAQVVSGISFLGAGVIFKNGATVKGLTTAAGLWFTAGIGLAVGAGMYLIGVLGTALIFVCQVVLHRLKIGRDALVASRVQFTVRNRPDLRAYVDGKFAEWQAQIAEFSVSTDSEGYISYDVIVRMARALEPSDLSELLSGCEDVKSYSLSPNF